MKESEKIDKMVSGGFEPWTIGKARNMKSALSTTGVAIHPFIYFIPCYYIINQLFEFLENEITRAMFIIFSNLHQFIDSSFLDEIERCKHQTCSF